MIFTQKQVKTEFETNTKSAIQMLTINELNEMKKLTVY
jgi:hypothetical protein